MIHKHWRMTKSFAALGILGSAVSFQARAFEVELFGTDITINNLATIGALLRLQDRDPSLIGKSNLNPGLCVQRVPGSPDSNPMFTGDTCNSTTNPQPNLDFVAARGAFSSNGDNGNLSFDQGEVAHAAVKMTTDINFDLFDYNFFARTLIFYDPLYENHDEVHPDTTAQPRKTQFSDKGRESLGFDAKFLDFFVSRNFELFDRDVGIKIGNQVINWGESAFLLLNSLNVLNPPDQGRLRIPGFDIKELSQPVGMVSINAHLFGETGFEAFYQYGWKPILADPVGSFFSQSDILGPGGQYAMLSFAKAPEDPNELYNPSRNNIVVNGGNGDVLSLVGSMSDRTLLIDHDASRRIRPQGGDQYGVAIRSYLENFNNGTEIGLYYARYHSRVPGVGAIAADDSCLNGAAPTCTVGLTTLPGFGTVPSLGGTGEPLPVGSARLVVEYPEDINMYGLSFNTNVGQWAFSGEYVFRDNLPVQVHSTDLIFAALQPAFPASAAPIPGIGPVPGRRDAVPDFLMTNYRGQTVQPNQYIPGYERMKVGQMGLTWLRLIGGSNWVNASQITFLLETGWTHVFDMPGLDEIQFQGGGGLDTHISSGADGTIGINPLDVRTNPGDPSTNGSTATLRQNPTNQSKRGFGTQDSVGYRLVGLTRYDNLFWGINTTFLTAVFHDVYGVSPGLGQNFVEDRLTTLLGIRFDYLSTYNAEIRWTHFADTNLDALRDRDNLLIFFGYQF